MARYPSVAPGTGIINYSYPTGRYPIKPYNPYEQKKTPPEKGYVFNFNDPYEINSLADVILNEAGLDRKYKGGLYDVPLIGDLAQRIVGLGEYLYDATVKPIAEKGDFGAAGLNLLNNLGETLDIVANPVKGLLMEGGEGFVKGLGLFSDKGRTNYTWDVETGAGGVVDFIANFGLEFLTDPLNWVTFGGAAIGKGAARGVAKEVIGETAEGVAKRFVTEAVGEATGTAAARAVKNALRQQFGSEAVKKFTAEFSQELNEEIIQSITHRLAQEIIDPRYVDEVARLASRKFFAGKITAESKDFATTLRDAADTVGKRLIDGNVWKSGGKDLGLNFKPNELTQDVMRITSEVISNRMSSSVLSGLRKFIDVTDTFENSLLKGTVLSSGFGIGWYGGKAILKGTDDALGQATQLSEKLTPFARERIAPIEDLPSINAVIDDQMRVGAAVSKTDPNLSPQMKGEIAIHLINKERRAIYEQVQLKKDPEEVIRLLNEYTSKEKGLSFPEYLSKLEGIVNQVTEEQSKYIQSHIKYMTALWDNAVKLFDVTDIERTIKSMDQFVKTTEQSYVLRRGFSSMRPDQQQLAAQFLRETPGKLQEFVKQDPIFLAKYQRVLGRFMRDPSVKNLNEVYMFFKKEQEFLKKQITANPTQYKSALDLVEKEAEGVIGEIQKITRALEKAQNDMQLTYSRIGEAVDLFPDDAQVKLYKRFVMDEEFDANAVKLSNLPNPIKARLLDAYNEFHAALISTGMNKASKHSAAEEFKEAIESTLRIDERQFDESGKHLLGLESDDLRGMFNAALYDSPVKNMSLDDIMQSTSAYEMLDINADTVGYILKMSHVSAAIKLYHMESIDTFINEVFEDSELKSMLLSLEDAGEKEIVDDLRQAANGIQLFKDLMNSIANSAELASYNNKSTNMLKTALIDTLMTYSDTSLARFAGNLEFFKREIKEKITNQINGFQKHRLALQDLIEEHKLTERFNEVLRGVDPSLVVGGIPKYHDSTVDILGTRFLAEEVLKNPTPEGITRVYFDFETTGLDVAAGDRLMEVSYHVDGQAPVKYRVQVPIHMAPSSEFVIKKMGYEDVDSFMTDWNSTADFADEQEAFAAFMNDLFALQNKGQRIQLAGQNIEGFDLKFVRSKLRSLNMGAMLQQFDSITHQTPVFDTMRAFMKKYDYFTFEGYPEVSDAIDAIVTNYIARRQLLTQNAQLLPTFAQQVDKYMAFRLSILAKEMEAKFGRRAVGAALLLRNTAGDILSTLGNIKTTNLALRNIAYIKEAIPAITEGSDIVERMFNINQLVAQNPEHLAMVSSKIVDNRPLIRQYFDTARIAPDGQINTQLAEKATELARRLDRIRKTIHNLEPLTGEVWEQYVRLGEDLRAHLLRNYPNHARSILWESLKVKGDNIKDTVATVEYLHREAITRASAAKKSFDVRRLYANLAAAAQGSPMDEAIHLLEEPKILRYTTSSDNLYLAYESIDPDNLWNLVIRDDVANVVRYAEEWNERAAGLASQEDILKRFGQESDANRMYVYGHQANVAIQLKLIPVLREVNEVVGKYMEGLSITGKESLKKAIFDYGNSKMLGVITHTLNMTPAEMQKHIWHRGLGLIRVDLHEFGGNKELNALVQKFMNNAKEFEKAYVKVRLVENALYIYPDAKHLDFFKKLAPPDKFAGDIAVPKGELPDEIAQAIDKIRDAVDDAANNASYRSTGSVITKENMRDMHLNIPNDIKKELVHVDDLVSINPNTGIPRSLFNSTRFDYSNLGSVIDRKYMQQYRSTNILKDYFSTVQALMLHADTATKTRALFFSPNSGLQLKDLFHGISDKEVLTELQKHPEYKLAMLVADPDGKEGYIAKSISVINEDSVRYAKKMNAIIVPESTFNMIDNVVRRKEISNAFAKWLSKYIVDPSKSGFLSSIGLLMRNTIDSTAKNLLSTGGTSEFGTMLRHTLQTAKWLQLYDSDVKAIVELSEKAAAQRGLKAAGMITEEAIEEYFSRPATFNRKDIFLLIHNFMVYGPSGGITKSTNDALQAAGKLQESDLWTKLIWKNPYTKLIMDSNTFVEQVSRLSKYTYDIMYKGNSTAKAMSEVIKTHFDYSTKSKAQLYMELVVPFITFTFNNIKYWWDMLSRYGWVAGLARDVLIPLTEINEYDQYELQRNRSLQYAILNGSLRLDDETNMVAKLSPSLLDAINTMIDPIGTMGQRIIAPLRVPVSGAVAALQGKEYDWEKQALTNLPFIGPTLQRYWGLDDDTVEKYDKGSAIKSSERTGSALPMAVPSVFGSIQRNYYFSYGGTIYMTHSQEKYVDHLLNGAKAIKTQAEAEAAYATTQSYPYKRSMYGTRPRKAYTSYSYGSGGGYTKRPWTRRTYHKKFYAKRSYPRKRAFFRGTYVPRAYKASTFDRVIEATRRTQMRMPGSYRNLAYTAPALYRKIYTGSGTNKFKSRLMPVTYKNIRYKIKQDWSALR